MVGASASSATAGLVPSLAQLVFCETTSAKMRLRHSATTSLATSSVVSIWRASDGTTSSSTVVSCNASVSTWLSNATSPLVF